jgi:hypothetical protein
MTLTTETEDGRQASTSTFRLSREDADNLRRQLAADITDWHIENQPEEHADPHERAALMDEYHEQQAEIERDLMFAEPF